MRCFVTGCGGFIGSALTDRLIAAGHDVVGYDNFSTGREPFLAPALANPRFTLVRSDLLDEPALREAIAGSDLVFHLAANADVRRGAEHPRRDLEQNTIVTSNVLEAMRLNGVRRIAFASTGSIYGETAVIPTPEDAPFPVQTSLYGASKLAAEGLIQAYCEAFGMQAWIFRFVSILGERYTHGHVFDFVASLRRDPIRLRVLGDGRQRKSYLYVQDCVSGVLAAIERSSAPVNILNLGTNDYCAVNDSIGWICEELGLSPTLEYTGGSRGWIGDVPFIWLDTTHARALGWEPEATIREGVVRTVRYLQANPWLFEDLE